MSTNFHELLVAAQITTEHYPVSGARILLPFGKSLLNRLEVNLRKSFQHLGYEESGLPEIVPQQFIDHLLQTGLYRVDNKNDTFHLAPSTETQAAFTAGSVVKSYRNLPFKISSLGMVRRQGSKFTLVSDLEYRSYELNGFFENKEEAVADITKADAHFKVFLDSMQIPYVCASYGPDPLTPKKYYALFPFSNKFASIYYSGLLADKFTSKLASGFAAKDGTMKHSIQANIGLTSRLLSIYLANHKDENGFLLEPDLAPYDIYLGTSEKIDDVADRLAGLLSSYSIFRSADNNWNRHEKRSNAMGLPAAIFPGIKQIRVCDRLHNTSQWVDENSVKPLVESIIKARRLRICPAAKIKMETITSPVKEYDGSVVYMIAADNETAFSKSGLKKLGYLDQSTIAYVCKKF